MLMITIERSKPAAAARSIALTIGLGVLAGCTSELPTKRAGTDQFLVEPIRLTHQVTFASGTSEINPNAPDELAAFLDEVDPDQNAELFLDANGPLSDERLDAVAAMLNHLGRTSSGMGGAASSEIGVTVTLADDILLPASCMDSDQWPSETLPPASCTSGLTLVRMVEDPDDLLRGRKLGPASGAGAAAAAARHLERTAPAAAEEVPAVAEGGPQPLLPSSPTTQDVSY